MSSAKNTPMMKQYERIKSLHRDKILLFHLGDFYEMFNEDAVTANRVLGLTLTKRSKGSGAVPLAGIPVRAAARYVDKLLRAGYKVAICDQVEDPATATGIVRREVTRVVTPGTLLDEGLLEEKRNNYLVSVFRGKNAAGIAYVDLSTGQFTVEEVPLKDLDDELARIAGTECLVPESTLREEEAEYRGRKKGRRAKPARDEGLDNLVQPTPYPDWAFDKEAAREKLLEKFGVSSLEGFGCEHMELAQRAAGAILNYLEETHKGAIAHLHPPTPLVSDDFLELDAAAIRNLELVQTIRTGGTSGSLLGVIDLTLTPMGARLMRRRLLRPLRKPDEINRRLDVVELFTSSQDVRARSREVLKTIRDVERLAARIGSERANARDLLAVADSLEGATELAKVLKPLLEPDRGGKEGLLQDDGQGPQPSPESKESRAKYTPRRSGGAKRKYTGREGVLAAICTPLDEEPARIAEVIRSRLRRDPPVTIMEGDIIADGVSEELDRLRGIRSGGRKWIAEFESRESTRTGISSLKVGYNRVFGYYIEVTKRNLHLVPDDYERKQTLVSAERFITPELKAHEEEVLSADERIKDMEYKLFCEFRKEMEGHIGLLQAVAAACARLDVAAALAELAVRNKYVRPVVDDSLVIDIADCRHPVLEVTLPTGAFVANDVLLDADSRQIMIITGPNMSGKSTYIRQVALAVILAQMGSFIPAASGRIGVVDRIFTRVGAADDIAGGRSTFMVEMIEAAKLLNNATRRSLIVLDEIGRGTSTYDGVSIAWAVAEYLHNNESVAARTLFATHYHELLELASGFDRIVNCNVAVKEWEGEVTFLHRIVPGGSDKSYGIYVAKLAGLPKAILKRANQILGLLEEHSRDLEIQSGRAGAGPRFKKPLQLSLFGGETERKVMRYLEALDTKTIAPVDAVVELDRLKRLAKGETPEE